MTKIRSNEAGVAHLAAIMAAVLVVAVGGVGYSVYNNQNKKSDQSNSVSEKSEVETKDALPAGFVPAVTVDKVKAVAATEAPGQDVLSIQLEMEDSKVVYSVKLADGTKLYIDATTGTVVKRVAADGTKVSDDDSTSPLPADFVPAVSAATARSTAEAKLPGKTVEVVKLEVEEGKNVWSVRFTDGSRVDVDATSGAVVRTKSNAPKASTSTSNSGSSNSGSSSNSGNSSNSDDSSDDSNDDKDDDSSDDSGSHSGSGSSGGGHSSDD